MRNTFLTVTALCTATLALSSCSSLSGPDGGSYGGSYAHNNRSSYSPPADYSSRLSPTIASTEKVVVVDPRSHAWGAYENGSLVKAGQATAGSGWCPDLGRPCHTSTGTFRVLSLGGPDCKSKIFPRPRGGAPMPYCMFFHGGQALHGVSEGEVVDGNISHGCVRLHVVDAEWLRFNFVNVGTKVVVKPY
jgi:lipoprotein-anchoring transpeptidase ErfK/SrfK